MTTSSTVPACLSGPPVMAARIATVSATWSSAPTRVMVRPPRQSTRQTLRTPGVRSISRICWSMASTAVLHEKGADHSAPWSPTTSLTDIMRLGHVKENCRLFRRFPYPPCSGGKKINTGGMESPVFRLSVVEMPEWERCPMRDFIGQCRAPHGPHPATPCRLPVGLCCGPYNSFLVNTVEDGQASFGSARPRRRLRLAYRCPGLQRAWLRRHEHGGPGTRPRGDQVRDLPSRLRQDRAVATVPRPGPGRPFRGHLRGGGGPRSRDRASGARAAWKCACPGGGVATRHLAASSTRQHRRGKTRFGAPPRVRPSGRRPGS